MFEHDAGGSVSGELINQRRRTGRRAIGQGERPERVRPKVLVGVLGMPSSVGMG